MPTSRAVRWIVAIAWLICAFLLERIITLGKITDASQAIRNPPLVLVVGVVLALIAIAIAIATMLGANGWAPVSLGLGIVYVIGGAWLLLANGHDSGIGIVLVAYLIAIASWRSLTRS